MISPPSTARNRDSDCSIDLLLHDIKWRRSARWAGLRFAAQSERRLSRGKENNEGIVKLFFKPFDSMNCKKSTEKFICEIRRHSATSAESIAFNRIGDDQTANAKVMTAD